MKKVVPLGVINTCVICFDRTTRGNSCVQCHVCILCDVCKTKVDTCPCCRITPFKQSSGAYVEKVVACLVIVLVLAAVATMSYMLDHVWLSMMLGLTVVGVGMILGICYGILEDCLTNTVSRDQP